MKQPFVWANVPYRQFKHTILDIYVPKSSLRGKCKSSVAVFVHGGGWQFGDKVESKLLCETIANAGMVAVSVNYRLAPESKYPSQGEDVHHALRWVYENIHRYGGCNTKVVGVGHSAGAHALFYALTMGSEVNKLVRCAIGISGVYNVVRLANASFYGSFAVKPVFGTKFQTYRRASIAHRCQRDACLLSDISVLLLTASSELHHFTKDADELNEQLPHSNHVIVPDTYHWSIAKQPSTIALIINYLKTNNFHFA